jgi:hypothetical protein
MIAAHTRSRPSSGLVPERRDNQAKVQFYSRFRAHPNLHASRFPEP